MDRKKISGFACLVEKGTEQIDVVFSASLKELKECTDFYLSMYGATLTFYHAVHSAERFGWPNVYIEIKEPVIRQGITLHLPSSIFSDSDFD